MKPKYTNRILIFIIILLLCYIFRGNLILSAIQSWGKVNMGNTPITENDFNYSFNMQYFGYGVGRINVNVTDTLEALKGYPEERMAYGVIVINGREVGQIKIRMDRVAFAIMKGYFPRGNYFNGECDNLSDKFEGVYVY